MSDTGYVYLIHFDRPICDNTTRSTTQHYAGWELWPGEREKKHRKGQGARLTQVAVEKGIGFEVVLRIEGDRNEERKLKNRKNLRAVCPHCAAEYERERREQERRRRESERVFAAMFLYFCAYVGLSPIIRFVLTAHVFNQKGSAA